MDLEILLALIPLLAFVAFLWFRGKAYLMFLQQEEYDNRRFLSWWWEAKAFDKRASLAFLAVFTVMFGAAWLDIGAELSILGLDFGHVVFHTSVASAIAWGAYTSVASTRKSKKPLVKTRRAKRINLLYSLLSVSILASAFFTLTFNLHSLPLFALIFVWSLLVLQLPPFILVLANKLLGPYERREQTKYLNEAKDKMRHMSPIVIGITGSYGKTSTKHILAHILSAAAPTLATPGSVNTPMGVTRIIREQLEERHKYFIVEMGAYGVGSISRLCDLAPPDHGIITSIGLAHLERFGDIETVFQAKFELADAVQAAGGASVINRDTISDDLLMLRANRDGFITVARRPPADLVIEDARLTTLGLAMTVNWQGEEHKLAVPLYGMQHAANIAASVAMAAHLGVDMTTVKAALANMPQIRHRLEVVKGREGPIVIDDAYNSNPTGFKAALETLSLLSREGGRRVLITPGMVELGAAHDEAHNDIGWAAAEHADLVLAVTPERIPTFTKAIESAGYGTEVMRFARQEDAEAWYKANTNPLDVVLFENNLPDLYEARPKF